MKYRLFIITFVAVALFGCKDYLDLVPEKDITTIESIFTKRKTALQFLNGCYVCSTPGAGDLGADPAMVGGDEFVTGDFLRNKSYSGSHYLSALKIAEGLQNPSSPILPLWGVREELNIPGKMRWDVYNCIRNCNTFIDHIDDVYDMSTDEKEEYKAEAIAQKALYYFELVRMYGPIVLVPKNISVEADVSEMQHPRAHVDTCFKRIVDLFDLAIPHLRPFNTQLPSRYGFMTRDAAYAYKAKALLFAASPLFNGNSWYTNFKNRDGNQLFSSNYDEKKWVDAANAIDEAIEYLESQGYKLYDLISDQSTDKLNVIRNIQNSVLPFAFGRPELIHGVWTFQLQDFRDKLPRYNSKHSMYNSIIYGNVNPSMRMVELFYTENGLPIDMDRNWPYQNRYETGVETDQSYKDVVKLNYPVINLHLKREPRFYADIAADKCMWLRGDNLVEMNPYRDGTHGTEEYLVKSDAIQNLTGYWVKKLVPKDVTGGPNPSMVAVAPFPKMRMADLYLMQAEAWNEISGPSAKVYDAIDKVRERAGIPPLQDAWNNYSKDPAKITTKEGLRDVIRQERLIEFAFEGHRFWDLRRWKIAHEYLNSPQKGWNIFGRDSKSFYNNYEGPVEVWSRIKFDVPRDYFWPIKDEEILKADIVQNLGW